MQLPAMLVRGKKAAQMLTEDVSYHGLFLRTDSPPSMRQLIEVRLQLPPTGEEVALHAMAMHTVKPDNQFKRTPGVGVQLYGLDKQVQTKWTEFIRLVQTAEEAKTPIAVLAAARPTEPVRRQHERLELDLPIEIAGIDDDDFPIEIETDRLQARTADISLGGMWVDSAFDFPIGTLLRIQVVHPDTKATLMLSARVTRNGPARRRGFAVEFDHFDRDKQKEFFNFLDSDAAPAKPKKK